jgi:hypothetical protein
MEDASNLLIGGYKFLGTSAEVPYWKFEETSDFKLPATTGGIRF